jgi:hypothetical protein
MPEAFMEPEDTIVEQTRDLETMLSWMRAQFSSSDFDKNKVRGIQGPKGCMPPA